MRKPRRRGHDGPVVWKQQPVVTELCVTCPAPPSTPNETQLLLALHFLDASVFHTLLCPPLQHMAIKWELLWQLCTVHRYANQEQTQKWQAGVQQTVEHMEATSKYMDNNRTTGGRDECEVISTPSRSRKYKNTDNNQTNKVCSLSHSWNLCSRSAEQYWKQQFGTLQLDACIMYMH